MYVAVDADGKMVSIKHASPTGEYFCPACGEPLIQKRGGEVAHHFAHYASSDCCMTAPMTEWHLSWQEEFPDEWREVVFEANGQQRRADIAHDDLIVEFQHSGISAGDIARRTGFYQSLGKRVVWVMDAKNYSIESLLSTKAASRGKLQYDGRFRVPNQTWFDSVIVDNTDIMVLDFHNVCAVLFDWDWFEFNEPENECSGCILGSRNFVVSLINGFQKLKDCDWWMPTYLNDNSDRLFKAVKYAVENANFDLEDWKIKNTLSMYGSWVIALDTVEVMKFPYLFLAKEKRLNQTDDWWIPFLSSANKCDSYSSAVELYGRYSSVWDAYFSSYIRKEMRNAQDWQPEEVYVDLSLVVYYILLSMAF